MILVLLCMSIAVVSPAEADTGLTKVYIIPVNGMIERALLYVIRRGVDQALREEAEAIIFDMDTPGGRLDATEEIIRLLIDLPPEIKTYTYVNKDALSAGAMIAMATDKIYMAPGSRIGASAPISITGDLEEGDMKEKIVSATLALVKSAAQRKGHDPKLAEAMMRKEFEYKIGDETISEEGELLTLTDIDAFREVERNEIKSPLLSSGTISSRAKLIETIGVQDAQITELTIQAAEQIARYIELFSLLFLVGGLLGIYIEFKTPGFGVPGLTGIVLLAIFFWGHNVAGLAGSGEIVLFLLGVILLLVEIFVIPGFGMAGLLGIACVAASLLMALMEHHPWDPWYVPQPQHVEKAVTTVGSAFFLSLLAILMLIKFLPKTAAVFPILLNRELKHEEGFTSSRDTSSIEGKTGTAVTDLRPAGIALIDGERLNVVAHGDFIDKDAPILVAEARGNRIVVELDGGTG